VNAMHVYMDIDITEYNQPRSRKDNVLFGSRKFIINHGTHKKHI